MDRPNPNTPTKRSFLGAIKGAFKKASKVFAPLFKKVDEAKPTFNESRLDATEYGVKSKLGRSFFTRHITSNTRAARLASLTHAEYLLAMGKGWTR